MHLNNALRRGHSLTEVFAKRQSLSPSRRTLAHPATHSAAPAGEGLPLAIVTGK